MNLIIPTESEAARIVRVRAAYWLTTQERWAKDRSRKKLMAKCRRFGGSYVEAWCQAEQTAEIGNVYDGWVGSRDLLAARLFNNDVKKFARVLNIAAINNGEIVLTDGDKDLRAFEIEMAGHFIRALSSSPDAFAGKQGRMTLDEFALHKEPRQLYSIVQPAIMRGGSLSIISTHRGSANFFNELVKEVEQKDNPKKFSFYKINIVEAVREGLWIKIKQTLEENDVADERRAWSDDEFLQSLRDECATEEAWQQEYMCQPCDEASALLTWEEIMQCSESAQERAAREIPPDAPRYVGLDVGRRNHPSVMWTFADVLGVLVTEKVVPMLNMPFAQQEQIYFAELARDCVRRSCPDATGLGMQLAENAAKKFPGKVSPITFSRQVKSELAIKAKRRFQDKSVRVPDDRKTQYELYSIKQKPSGDTLIITSEAGLSEGHSDYAWAAFLGIHAAENTSTPFGFTPLKKAERGSMFDRVRRLVMP